MPVELSYEGKEVDLNLIPKETRELVKRIGEMEKMIEAIRFEGLSEHESLRSRDAQRQQILNELLQRRGEAMGMIPKLQYGIEDQRSD